MLENVTSEFCKSHFDYQGIKHEKLIELEKWLIMEFLQKNISRLALGIFWSQVEIQLYQVIWHKNRLFNTISIDFTNHLISIRNNNWLKKKWILKIFFILALYLLKTMDQLSVGIKTMGRRALNPHFSFASFLEFLRNSI